MADLIERLWVDTSAFDARRITIYALGCLLFSSGARFGVADTLASHVLGAAERRSSLGADDHERRGIRVMDLLAISFVRDPGRRFI